VEQIESIRKVSVVTTTRRSIFSFSFCSGNKTKKQNKTKQEKTKQDKASPNFSLSRMMQ